MKYLLDFDRHFPGTRTILMMDNYRSTPEILAAANALIDKNEQRIQKELVPTLPTGCRRPAAWRKTRRRRRTGWHRRCCGSTRAACPGGTWPSSTGPTM